MNQIIACPSCQRKVTVPQEYFGKHVQCPQCEHTFTALDPAAGAVQPGMPAAVKLAPEERLGRRDAWDDNSSFDGYSRRGLDADDSTDIALQRTALPHRGATILTLGILSLVLWFCAPVLGPVAWLMGHADLAQIRAGNMDHTGESMTQAGMVLGMVMTILASLALAFFCFLAMLG